MTAAVEDVKNVPINPEELANFLTEDLRADVANDPVKMATLLASYGEKFAAKYKETEAEKNAKFELQITEFLEKHDSQVGARFKPGQVAAGLRKERTNGLKGFDKGQIHNKKAPGAAFDADFGDDVQQFFRMAYARPEQMKDHAELIAMRQKHAQISNAASSTVPSDGGFLIPEILRTEIMQLALESSIVRQRATVIPMDSLKVPIPTVDETSRVSNIYGGIQFMWIAEGGPGVDTSAKFGQVTLDAKKLMGYAGIPNELWKDSPAFAAWFGQKFPGGWSWFEDISYLTGDGVSQPLGILNAPGAVKTTRSGGTGTATLSYDDVVKMYMRMYPSSVKNAEWVASFDVVPALMELTFTPSGGTTPVPVMLWQPNAAGVPTATILGRPITFTEKVPAFGTAGGGDLAFLDFSEYLIGDRQAMSLESSTEYLFGVDKTAFRVIGRVDGQPWLPSAITPHNGSANTLSTYVILD